MRSLARSLKSLYHSQKYPHSSARTLSSLEFKCAKCAGFVRERGAASFFCSSCSWPVDPGILRERNLYALFSLDPTYAIDKQRLSQTYKQYQLVLHPDKHADKTPEEFEIITANSSLVSTSYNTLLDDKKRARYLFDMKYGSEMFREQINSTDQDQLEYIMETHERIESISSEAERRQLRDEFGRKMEEAVRGIDRSFQDDEPLSVIRHFRTLSFYRQIYEKLAQ